MKLERLLTIFVSALLLLVCAKFPVWGIIHLERKLDVYPLVSKQTIATLDEMSTTLNDFGEACEAYQAAERDLMVLGDCTVVTVGGNMTCDELRIEAQEDMDLAAADRDTAVAARKALARQADWSLLKSMMIGGQGYTHSTWLCASAYATFGMQITLGFTPTYNVLAS